MCEFMKVSRSAYYTWLERPLSNRKQEDLFYKCLIREIVTNYRNVYGARRVKQVLEREGYNVSKTRIIRLMKEENLVCKTKKKFKVKTDSKHNNPVAPNILKRNFQCDKPNQCWVGDITYISTESGWIYLAVVLDLFSRQVVGWATSKSLHSDLVNEALLMALWKRKPKPGLVWHTDRGSQYASEEHRKILTDHGVKQSMSRKGDCWDNAVAESFFHTIKTESINHYKFKNQKEARDVIFEYIEVFYNRQRLHSANNYMAPVDFENIKKCA